MAAYFPNLSKDNISLYTIPVCWAVALSPRIWGVVRYSSAAKKGMDARAPREFQKSIQSDASLDSATKAKLQRADAAHNNGVENLALFTSAVVAGNAARLDVETLNNLSIAYIVSRVVYNYVYINNESKGMAQFRTGVFFAGLGTVMALFVKAGIKWNEALV